MALLKEFKIEGLNQITVVRKYSLVEVVIKRLRGKHALIKTKKKSYNTRKLSPN